MHENTYNRNSPSLISFITFGIGCKRRIIKPVIVGRGFAGTFFKRPVKGAVFLISQQGGQIGHRNVGFL